MRTVRNRFYGDAVVVIVSERIATNGGVAVGQGDCKIVAVKGASQLLRVIREKWHRFTPWLSATSCSAVASQAGFLSVAALRAITISFNGNGFAVPLNKWRYVFRHINIRP